MGMNCMHMNMSYIIYINNVHTYIVVCNIYIYICKAISLHSGVVTLYSGVKTLYCRPPFRSNAAIFWSFIVAIEGLLGSLAFSLMVFIDLSLSDSEVGCSLTHWLLNKLDLFRWPKSGFEGHHEAPCFFAVQSWWVLWPLRDGPGARGSIDPSPDSRAPWTFHKILDFYFWFLGMYEHCFRLILGISDWAFLRSWAFFEWFQIDSEDAGDG